MLPLQWQATNWHQKIEVWPFIGTIFCSSQFTPKPALFLIYIYAITQGVLFYFIKGAVLILTLDLFKGSNYFYFICWMGSVHHDDYPNCHTKGSIFIMMTTKPLHQGGWFITMTTQVIIPMRSVHHEDHTKPLHQGGHHVTNEGTGNLPLDATVVFTIIL